MPVVKDPRKEATDRIYAEYGREIREANFAREAAVRAAIKKRNDALAELAQQHMVRVSAGEREAV